MFGRVVGLRIAEPGLPHQGVIFPCATAVEPRGAGERSLLGPFPTWPPTMGFLFAGRCDLGAWVLLKWQSFDSGEPLLHLSHGQRY